MKRMSLDRTGPTTLRRTDEAKVFRVEPTGLEGWVVYLVGAPKTYGFLSQLLATTYAQKLARGNRPSVVIVTEADGTVVKAWEFPVNAESVDRR
jgi:hypothetical protein